MANSIAEAGSKCFRVKTKIFLEKQRFPFDGNLCSVISGLVSVGGTGSQRKVAVAPGSMSLSDLCV